jgi:hypothetical protein
MEDDPKWKKFERLAAAVQKALAPSATVIHDDKIYGYISKSIRQIDISIRQKIGNYDILIVVDCKDYNKPVDVNDVEDFCGLVEDVKAQKGAMISSRGFTQAAKNVATNKAIDLYKLIDAEQSDWLGYVSIPFLCEDIRVKSYSFTLRSSYPESTTIPNIDIRFLEIYDQNKNYMGLLFNLMAEKWNKGELPHSVSEHRDVEFLPKPILINFKDNWYRLDITVNLKVESKLYFGQVPVIEMKGLRDEITGIIHTKGFTTSDIAPEIVEKDWKLIVDEKEIAVTPVGKLSYCSTYGLLPDPKKELNQNQE